FASDLQPASRADLLFQTLPLAFDQLPMGRMMGTVFFLALVLAAWLSGIGLIEPLIAWTGETWQLSRWKAAFLCGLGAWLLGVVSVLSFNYWGFSFKFLGGVKTLGAFDLLQIFTSSTLLPISGMALALYAGWMLKRDATVALFSGVSPCAHDAWLWSVRIVTPTLLFVVFVTVPRLFL
ncbi:MAG: sodium-dependent transporter, partial [Acidiferrobacterales bacterium]